MQLNQFYAPVSPQTQPVSQASSAARDTTQDQAPAQGSSAVSISWIGILIALVLLRVVYEVSE